MHDPTYVKYLKIVRFMEAERRIVVVRAGGGRGELPSNGYKMSVLQGESGPEICYSALGL